MSIYRLLLRIYPSSFRAEYEEELVHLHRQKREEISGAWRSFMFLLSDLLDVLQNAFLVHLDLFKADFVYTIRLILRSPGFAITAILVTALGIGANTAVFSMVNHILIRPFPYQDSDRIVRIWEKVPVYSRTEASPPNFLDWRRRSSSFEKMAAYTGTSLNLVGNGNPERIDATLMTVDMLPLLGVKPVIGQLLSQEHFQTGSPPVALLSYGLWQSRYASNPRIVGQSIRLNDRAHTVIGVLPAWFTFPDRETRLWIPIHFAEENGDEDRDNNYLLVIAKLKRNISLDQAQAEMGALARGLEREFPIENARTGVTIERLRDTVPQQSRLILAALMGASICILLIACTNLANLFLVRAIGRQKELTVRAALGAGRERLVRQLLTESLVFALIGAAIGILAASGSIPLLSKLIPTSLPVGDATILDIRVIGFTGILFLITVLGFGAIPALRISGKADTGELRQGPRSVIGDRKERLRSTLVIVEVTASVILLISTGLLIRAVWRVQAVPPGFEAENVLTLQTPLPMPKYEKTAQRIDFYSRVLNDIRALPDVSNAAFISFLPMVMRGGIWEILLEGGVKSAAEDPMNAGLRYISPGFFNSTGIPIKLGRDVSESDTIESPLVAVVSESFVRTYWPGLRENPIGRRFHVAFDDRTIVGVVGDIRFRGLEYTSEPQVYLPYKQVKDGNLQFYVPKALVIKTKNESNPAEAVRRIIQKTDPEMPVMDVRTLQDILNDETTSRVIQIRVIGIFTLLSLVLAGIGIHGLLSFSLSQRIPEIGLRIALGARSNDILKTVLNKGFQVAIFGVALGVILAFLAAQAMQSLLAGIQPWDVVTFFSASVVALLMTISGCLFPALRAIRVDPAIVMREA
jgi:putative ABC transport system permease protein